METNAARPLRILQICTYDRGGGAERVAYDLHGALRAAGQDSRMLVRLRRTDDETVVEADPYAGAAPWAPAARAIEGAVAAGPRFRGQYRIRDWVRRSAWPQRWIDHLSGAEDFNYPDSHALLDGEWRPDIIHAHNLHGDFFDLRALAALSARAPVVWTLHDAWALTGHCAYFIDCERWRSGCGSCPDLRRAPAIRRDRTAENWARKRAIYAQSHLAVVTPSRWLMDQVEQAGVRPWRSAVIHNGVDTAVYRPADKLAARAELGLPADAFICVYVAHSLGGHNPYKDVTTVGRAVAAAAELAEDASLVFLQVGGGAAGERTEGRARIRATGYLSRPELVARHYQAADVLLHAANADNFPCVVLEALACGTPVIATAVGGIPEAIVEGETGLLVGRGDSDGMARRLVELLRDPGRLAAMGRKAAEVAAREYALDRHADGYVAWYGELLRAHAAERSEGWGSHKSSLSHTS